MSPCLNVRKLGIAKNGCESKLNSPAFLSRHCGVLDIPLVTSDQQPTPRCSSRCETVRLLMSFCPSPIIKFRRSVSPSSSSLLSSENVHIPCRNTMYVECPKLFSRFLDENPSEVVFVDFHEFPYHFDQYAELAKLVESCLGKFRCADSFTENFKADQECR